MDFTIITPNRASANAASGAALMDQAARIKDKKSAELCKVAGWDFFAFVGDTYGALRSDARDFVSRFISRNAAKFEPLTIAEVPCHLEHGQCGVALTRSNAAMPTKID